MPTKLPKKMRSKSPEALTLHHSTAAHCVTSGDFFSWDICVNCYYMAKWTMSTLDILLHFSCIQNRRMVQVGRHL